MSENIINVNKLPKIKRAFIRLVIDSTNPPFNAKNIKTVEIIKEYIDYYSDHLCKNVIFLKKVMLIVDNKHKYGVEVIDIEEEDYMDYKIICKMYKWDDEEEIYIDRTVDYISEIDEFDIKELELIDKIQEILQLESENILDYINIADIEIIRVIKNKYNEEYPDLFVSGLKYYYEELLPEYENRKKGIRNKFIDVFPNDKDFEEHVNWYKKKEEKFKQILKKYE